MLEVTISVEKERGCGFRNAGAGGVGLYLRGVPGLWERCERLPYPLDICPCCGAGIKFSRSWTTIDASRLFAPNRAPKCDVHKEPNHNHGHCRLCSPATFAAEKAGLLWIGRRHYSPHSFTKEALEMGVSRKLPSVPRGFEPDNTAIYLAHLDAVVHDGMEFGEEEQPTTPGVFMVLAPGTVRFDLVVDIDIDGEDGEEVQVDEDLIPERAQNILKRLGDAGRLVKVKRDLDQLPLIDEEE